MIPNGMVEQGLLQMRVDELERRLARLEEQTARRAQELPEARSDAVAETDAHAGDGPSEIAQPAREIDLRNADAPDFNDPDEALEGARLVAIELLSSGYKRQDVAGYLRSTFGVAASDAVAIAAEPVPG